MVWLPDGEKKFENMFNYLDTIRERDGHRTEMDIHHMNDGVGRATPAWL